VVKTPTLGFDTRKSHNEGQYHTTIDKNVIKKGFQTEILTRPYTMFLTCPYTVFCVPQHGHEQTSL
jgi:hypothetical protein